MSATLDGIEYVLKEPSDNALDLLNYINAYCTTNSIKDSNGNILQFIVNAASPIWLIILGIGYMLTIYQKLVYSVGQNFNIASCNTQQLYNLMEIAGTAPLPATATTVEFIATATSAGEALITTNNTATLNGSAFKVVYDITIPAGESAIVYLIAEEVGPLYIAGGPVTFDQEVENIESVISLNTQPGKTAETVAESRYRLQNLPNRLAGFEALDTYLNALPGITSARVEFNASIQQVVIDGITVPARTTLLVIQGMSSAIAEGYWRYMIVPTAGGPNTQDYTFDNGQSLPVTWYNPGTTEIELSIEILDTNYPSEQYYAEMESLLQSFTNTLKVGQEISQAMIIEALSNAELFEIVSASLTLKGTEDWKTIIEIGETHIGVIDLSNIIITEV